MASVGAVASSASDKLMIPDESMAALLDLSDRVVPVCAPESVGPSQQVALEDRIADSQDAGQPGQDSPARSDREMPQMQALEDAEHRMQQHQGPERVINVLQIWLSCTDAGTDARASRIGAPHYCHIVATTLNCEAGRSSFC